MVTQELACMEVWGGNQPTYSTFEKSGLDIWLFSRPCDQSSGGGDIYYLSSCASGRITRLLLADIAGHGEPVSSIAVSLRDLMRKHINQILPSQLFQNINVEFTAERHHDRFATAIIQSYFVPTRKLRICNAGHPPPYLKRAGESDWRMVLFPKTLERRDLPFGVIEESDYQQMEIPFRTGDLLFSYTDGLAELENPDGSLFGFEGIENILAASEDAQQIVEAFVNLIESAANAGRVADDVTLSLIRANSRSVSLRDNLFSPFRLIGSLFSQ